MRLSKTEHAYFQSCARELLQHKKVQSMNGFIQHGSISCLEHSLSVAYASYWLCLRLHLRVDCRSLIRGALLHDFFLYDWHGIGLQYGVHGFTHPCTALKNAQKCFRLNDTEQSIIRSHMWPLTLRHLPRSREALVVCLMDKRCSLRETFGRA